MYLNKLSTICLQRFREKNSDSVKITFDMNLTGCEELIRVSSASEDILTLIKSMPSKEVQLPTVHPVIQV